jgi:hypothetical protein
VIVGTPDFVAIGLPFLHAVSDFLMAAAFAWAPALSPGSP